MTEHLTSKKVVQDYRDAVGRFLTALSNPGGHVFAVRNEPGTPYHDLVLAGMQLDAALVRPADETKEPLRAADVVPDREFYWMKGVPGAHCKVRVDEVRHEPNGDVRVFTTTLEATGLNAVGDKCWNDMSRFLEACTAVSEEGRR